MRDNPENPRGWWSGDGNDSSVLLKGDVTYGRGVISNAYLFDGNGDWVDLGKKYGDFGQANFALDLWVWFDDFVGEQVIIDNFDSYHTGGSAGWRLLKGLDNSIVFGFQGIEHIAVPKEYVKVNTWHHIAVTRDGRAFTMYFDGVARAENDLNPNLTSVASLKLAAGSTDDLEKPLNGFLRGAIDEVRIFDRSLSPSEVVSFFESVDPESRAHLSKSTSLKAPRTIVSHIDSSTVYNALYKKAQYFNQKVGNTDSALYYFKKVSSAFASDNNWGAYLFTSTDVAEQYRRKGSYKTALDELHKALDKFTVYQEKEGSVCSTEVTYLRDHDPSYALAMTYNKLAYLYESLSDYKKALHWNDRYTKSCWIRNDANYIEQAKPFTNEGIFSLKLGDHDRALRAFLKAKSRQVKSPAGIQALEAIQSLVHIGDAYKAQGHLDQALNYYERALQAFIDILGRDHPRIADTYERIGIVYQQIGDGGQAIEYLKSAINLHEIIPGGEQRFEDVKSVDRILNRASLHERLGLYYSEAKNYEKALEHLGISLQLENTILVPDHPHIANTYNRIGQVLFKKGEFDTAMDYLHEAKRIYLLTIGDSNVDIARLYTDMGRVYLAKGDTKKALLHQTRALNMHESIFGRHHYLLSENLNHIGQILITDGEFHAAIKVLQEALVINTDTSAALAAHHNRQYDYFISDNHALTTLLWKGQALKKRPSILEQGQSDLKAALATFRAASRLAERMQRSYRSEESKLFIAEKAASLFEEAIQTALQLYRLTGIEAYQEEAFYFAEKNKASILLESIVEMQARSSTGIPDSLLVVERQIRTSLSTYSLLLAQERGRRASRRDSTSITQWEEKHFELQRKYVELISRFESDYPEYYALKYGAHETHIETLQRRLLEQKLTLVEYFVGADSIYIFVVSPSAFDVTTTTRNEQLEDWIQEFRASIGKNPNSPGLAPDYSSFTRVGFQLYRALIEPIESLIDTDRLLLIPDGALHYIPFEAVLSERVDQKADGYNYQSLPYLIREYEFSYAYSTSLFMEITERKHREHDLTFLAFAPVFTGGLPTEYNVDIEARLDTTWHARHGNGALPATRSEIKGVEGIIEPWYDISSWLSSRTGVYVGKDAQEDQLKSDNSARYQYIHIATHGLTNEQEPLLSRLLFARPPETSNEDGMLHLAEIYNLRLNADLVVLSACDTGLGQLAQGEGIIGLTRGFLYAGADRVLVSLWKVADLQTRDLMVDFYMLLMEGMEESRALRHAKMDMLDRGGILSMPYYWSSFVLVGH